MKQKTYAEIKRERKTIAINAVKTKVLTVPAPVVKATDVDIEWDDLIDGVHHNGS